jgi:hypothetical protein
LVSGLHNTAVEDLPSKGFLRAEWLLLLKLLRRKWLLKWLVKSICMLMMLVLISACGESEESGSIPTPEPPTTPQTVPFTPPVEPPVDPRIPDLRNAVPIVLTDSVNFSGLEDLSQVIFLPIVGDPLVKINISDGRSQSVSGDVLVAFEDREGFWGAQLESFEQTGIRTSTQIDMIFADDELVIRVVGVIVGNDLNGVVYYRQKQAEENECRKVVVTCDPVGPFFPAGNGSGSCDTTVDVSTPCRAYMSTSLSQVKQLGSFSATYSDWVTRK